MQFSGKFLLWRKVSSYKCSEIFIITSMNWQIIGHCQFNRPFLVLKNGLCLIIDKLLFFLNISGNLFYKTTLTNTRRLKTSNIGGSQLIKTTNSRARYNVLHQMAGPLSPGEARVPSQLWGTADIGVHWGKGGRTSGTTTTQIGRNVVQLRKRSRLLTTQTQVGQKSKKAKLLELECN